MASRELQPHHHHNSTVLAELEEGDLIEFNRGLYSHWAVYYGDGKVIHLAGDENDGLNATYNSGSAFTICGKSFNKAFVRIDDFWNVVLDSKAKKNNSKDKKMRPLSPTEIIQRAKEKLGAIGYNVLWSNCEHFASYCRYGSSKSEQADKFMTWATVGAVAGAVLGIAIGSAGSKKKKQES